ncbi:MAG: DNA-3-methyladenine glycosylase [Candidatus Omnitrophica bacterium]|nr:DNA-3-methyladenine glycosylase [Candidatus Omnitrophota bacterium]MCM8810920.1 DNA-3-methyladenine glycosylase [Candidatus Omnitrophota bacterium]MCM8832650.1 DNA-3-methyladenine glycosylase [Candidatus Omnitrophota bacterium]
MVFKHIKREFFERNPVVVAKELLGKYLVREVDREKIIGKIVETEAYGGIEDKGCHVGRFGKTKRTEILFGQVGKAYIYPVYINTYCLNVVSHENGKAGGVLFRAIEPISGIEKVLENLNKKEKYDITKILNGPGKICKGLKIDRKLNGEDMVEGRLIYLLEGEKIKEEEIMATPRINIPYAGKDKDLPWRFIIKNSKFLSR